MFGQIGLCFKEKGGGFSGICKMNAAFFGETK